ncbi:sensor histidine kinase [Cohnella sp. GCM10012308]|uniref:sensor histidine kinase n=1 Tax=Cohnella sp. GCM10012308 TaxID=3317329 RepID=UPI00360C9675
MRISIKLKTSAFLAALLLLTVIVLSLLVLQGIQKNQRAQVEQYLAQQASTANTYLYQSLTAEPNKVPETYLASKGAEFGKQLEWISGQTVELYDADGKAIYKNKSGAVSEGIGQTLSYALQQKTAYLVEGDSLYYLSPLNVGNEQVGVVQFYYDLAANDVFYHQIRQLFVFIGAGTFLLSFILAYFYFNALSGSIIKLNQTVNRIREGSYETAVLARKDELGELGEGIRMMSERIRRTIRDKDEEQEKLKLAVDKLSKLDQQQKQFIGNVTHEFKTPLTSIKAYLDLMDMYPDDEELLQTAKTNIAGDTQRLYEMVEKVLQLSALEKYDFEFSKEKVDVRRTIESVLGSLQGKMEKFGLRLETNLTEASADADRDSLTIVLMNLLDNAIKYNKAKGSISVSCAERAGQVVIEIADTGIGIPQAVVHKIFEPFYTVDKNRSRENGGAGLGLALAKKYAEMQGGSIALLRSDAEGTTFSVAYPAWGSRESA